MSVGFSQSFPLEPNLLARVLREYQINSKVNKGELGSRVGLNQAKIEGVSGWLRILNLWRSKEGITPLAALILKYDEYFSQAGTKWLLHQSLITNPAAEVWYFGFNKYFKIGETFTREDLTESLLQAEIGTKTRYLRTDVGMLLSGYAERTDSFKDLHLLSKTNEIYEPAASTNVPPLILAYSLYSWREQQGGISTTSIQTLLNEGSTPGKVFLLNRSQLLNHLHILEETGIVKIAQIADLDNITYTYDGSALNLLEQFYETAH